ncbi:MAG: flagellar hook-basal body protein [Peptococcaceae bacterium]|nr:flagellar hook-basal body protein [Peptococcaceae bacterium]
MIRGLFTAASGLGVLQARMDTTSNNLANVSTTGFKQDRVQVAAFPDLLLQERIRGGVGGPGLGGWAPVGRTNQGAVVTGVYTDHGTGILHETGRETDLALSGEGFFAFEAGGAGEGRILYSRDGELHRDSEGYLVNSRGHRILGESGEPVQVGGGSFTVSPEGVVTTSDGGEERLMIMDFPDKTKLIKEGNGYFSAPQGEGVAVENPGVTQHFLEKSNVDVAAEMVNMIEIVRAYEAVQKIVQAHDELMDGAINRVGTVK